MATQATSEIEEDPFETLSARFAFEHQDNPREFKKLMAALVKTGEIDRETMLIAAVELMVVKLPKVAIAVRDAANKCPSRGNIEVFWPYSASAKLNPTSVRAAQASAERKLLRWRKQIEPLLAKANLDWTWLGDGELSSSGELTAEG
jgi:hypothetical protein